MKLVYTIGLLLFLHNTKAQKDIFESARTNNTLAIKYYLDQNQKIDTLNTNQHSLLTLAVYNNAYEVSQLLIKHKANLEIKDKSGNTALMGACFKGYTSIVKLLLRAGANPNQLNYNNANALFFAATFGHFEIAKLLVKYRVNTDQRDNLGNTALHYATIQDNTDIIRLLNTHK